MHTYDRHYFHYKQDKVNVALRVFVGFFFKNGYTELNMSMCQESESKGKSRYKQNWFIQQDENVMH